MATLKICLSFVLTLFMISAARANDLKTDSRKSALTMHGDAAIEFVFPSGKHSRVSMTELSKLLPAEELFLKANPAYKNAPKKYRGFRLIKMLKALDPQGSYYEAGKFNLKVTCKDGWTPPTYHSKTLMRGNALLAFEEDVTTLKAPISPDQLWSLPLNETNNQLQYPGPFYLVWNGLAEKNPDIMPLQVSGITVILGDSPK